MAAPVLPKLVGERIKRREDPRLIQGRATYVDDMKIAGMLHLAFKRSDVAHAKITKLDISAAEAMPEMFVVICSVAAATDSACADICWLCDRRSCETPDNSPADSPSRSASVRVCVTTSINLAAILSEDSANWPISSR